MIMLIIGLIDNRQSEVTLFILPSDVKDRQHHIIFRIFNVMYYYIITASLAAAAISTATRYDDYYDDDTGVVIIIIIKTTITVITLIIILLPHLSTTYGFSGQSLELILLFLLDDDGNHG